MLPNKWAHSAGRSLKIMACRTSLSEDSVKPCRLCRSGRPAHARKKNRKKTESRPPRNKPRPEGGASFYLLADAPKIKTSFPDSCFPASSLSRPPSPVHSIRAGQIRTKKERVRLPLLFVFSGEPPPVPRHGGGYFFSFSSASSPCRYS